MPPLECERRRTREVPKFFAGRRNLAEAWWLRGALRLTVPALSGKSRLELTREQQQPLRDLFALDLVQQDREVVEA